MTADFQSTQSTWGSSGSPIVLVSGTAGDSRKTTSCTASAMLRIAQNLVGPWSNRQSRACHAASCYGTFGKLECWTSPELKAKNHRAVLGSGAQMRSARSSHSKSTRASAKGGWPSSKSGALRRVPRGARRPKLPLRETLTMLRVIATRRTTVQNLTRTVDMSRATVYRLLSGCRRELGMRIDCESGVLKLRDWGVLNRRRVLK